MSYVLVVEFLALLFVVWIIATQIVTPARAGRPLFPMFSRLPKLEEELAKARQASDEAAIEKNIAEEKSKLTPRE